MYIVQGTHGETIPNMVIILEINESCVASMTHVMWYTDND